MIPTVVTYRRNARAAAPARSNPQMEVTHRSRGQHARILYRWTVEPSRIWSVPRWRVFVLFSLYDARKHPRIAAVDCTGEGAARILRRGLLSPASYLNASGAVTTAPRP
jgi:hypothetical protein